MAVSVIVAVLALAAAVVVGVTWRRAADERVSVKDHQRTLETLRQLPDRRVHEAPGQQRNGAPSDADPERRRSPPASDGSIGSSRTTNGASRPAPGGHRGQPADDPEPADRSRAGTASPKVDTGSSPARVSVDDGAPVVLGRYADPGARSRAALTTPRPAGELRSDGTVVERGPSPLAPRTLGSRRTVAIAAALVVVGGVLGLAVTLSTSSARHAASHPARVTSARGQHVATSKVITPASSGSFDATYAAPRPPYTVELDATGPCWVMATDAAKGTVVWTGTLSAGDRRPIVATGGLVVRLGSVGVTVSLDGKPVQLPAGLHAPFDLTFRHA
jgi:hypothetical protein